MFNTLEEMLDFAKKIETIRMTADGIVCAVPCFLFDIHFCTNATNPSTGLAYDGTDTNGKPMLDFTGPKSTTFLHPHTIPMYFAIGIYWDEGDNVTGTTFCFLREGR